MMSEKRKYCERCVYKDACYYFDHYCPAVNNNENLKKKNEQLNRLRDWLKAELHSINHQRICVTRRGWRRSRVAEKENFELKQRIRELEDKNKEQEIVDYFNKIDNHFRNWYYCAPWIQIICNDYEKCELCAIGKIARYFYESDRLKKVDVK
jgi:hypothetical protein